MALNGRILIVEDDTSVREMLAEYLRTHGYEVAQADHGTARGGRKVLAGRRAARRQSSGG
jgi:DNA-binding response OmpR family regulator